MDALALIVSLFLGGCAHGQPEAVVIDGHGYSVERYTCAADRHYEVWHRQCQGGYLSRPFLLKAQESGQGFYMNRFAEVHSGWHVRLDEVYFPACEA